MSTAANYTAMTLGGTPGTGPATLVAALAAPNRSFFAAFGAGTRTIDVEWYSDASATTALGCETVTYNGADPGTLTRGTAETPNSLVSLPAGASVRVINPASAINRYESAGLNSVAGANANTTMLPDTLYEIDLSPFTGTRDYTLPTTAVDGQEIEVALNSSNASFELRLLTGAGQTCAMGGSVIAAASEITRLFIAGERMRFKYVATNKWRAIDGRIPCDMLFRLGTMANTTEAASTFVVPTDRSGVWTADQNKGACGTTSNGRFTARRAGSYMIMGRAFPQVAVGDAASFTANVFDGTTTFAVQQIVQGGSAQPQYSYTGKALLALAAYLQFRYRSSEGSKGLNTDTTFSVVEVL